MMPFREAVNLRKAYRRLGFRVNRDLSSSIQAKGLATVGRHEEDPLSRLHQWLPYAHKSAVMRGFSTLTNERKNMGTRIDRLIELNKKLPEIINFASDDDYKPRILERALIGNPTSILIHGRRGEKIGGASEAIGRNIINVGAGTAIGAGVGAGVGGAIGAIRGKPGAATLGALSGAQLGSLGGAGIGGLRATFGKKGEQMYKRRTYTYSSKHSRLVELNARVSKLVEFDSDNGIVGTAATVGAGAGLGWGGTRAYQAVKKKQMGAAGVLVGGEHAGLTTAPSFTSAAKEVGQQALAKTPEAIRTGVAAAGKKGLSALDRVLGAFKLARAAV